MSTQAIRELIDEIDSLQQEIDYSQVAWDMGIDELAMAACDPSDQFIKSEKIKDLWKQIFEITVNEVAE